MSPRRRLGLSLKHLKALEHLADVVEALEALQQQHAKVRALVTHGPPQPLSGGHITLTEVCCDRHSTGRICVKAAGHDGDHGDREGVYWATGRDGLVSRGFTAAELAAQREMAMDFNARQGMKLENAKHMRTTDAFGLAPPGVRWGMPDPHNPGKYIVPPTPPAGALYPLASPTLDTPERQEFEAARKAGKPVPPDFANLSDAQKERMAEQRALVEQLRAARGLVRPVASPGRPLDLEEALAASPDEAPDEAPVREEVLQESANGSAGADMETGGFTDG